jgi:flagellar assembly protein FliH
VIKAGQAARVLPNLSRVDLADHLAEARSVVEQARREAAQIVAEARVQAEALREVAHRAGHESGVPQGLEEGRQRGHDEAFRAAKAEFTAKHASLVAALTTALAEVETIKQTLQLEAERDVLAYAVDLATKLTFDIGRRHREAAVENLRRALRTVGSPTDVTIRINPADAATIETFCGGELALPVDAAHVRVLTDEAIAPGGCRVERGPCEVDASLETQTAQLVALVLGEHDGGERPAGE